MGQARTDYIEACAEVARAFEPDGFKFAKSGPHTSRKVGDWRQEISFFSSYANISGATSWLEVYVSVFNRKLGGWAEKHGTPRPATRENSYAHVRLGRWNVARADPEMREELASLTRDAHQSVESVLGTMVAREDMNAVGSEAVHRVSMGRRPAIAEVVETIQREGFPLFEHFSTNETLKKAIVGGGIPSLRPLCALEILGYYFDDEVASEYADSWSAANPERAALKLFWITS